MKFSIIILALVLFATTVIANPLETLDSFYQASVDEDLEAYIAVQDPLFLESLNVSYDDYFKAFFETVDTLDYEIINPEVIENDNSALIFYELKGKFKAEGKEEKIDNDMVAFLWKYDDWKVRWTISRKMYEDKIAMSVIMDSVVESSIETGKSEKLEQEFIDNNIDYNFKELSEDYKLKEDSRNYSFVWVLVVLILLAAIVYFFKDRLKIHTKKAGSSVKHHFKKTSHKIKPGLNELSSVSKKSWENVKPLIKKESDELKDGWKKAKPNIVKCCKDLKENIKSKVKKDK